MQKKIGPAWTDRGRAPVGWFTKRAAEAWLRDVLDQAGRGTLAGMVRTAATFADAAAEWLRFIEEDRARKPSTLLDHRSALKAHLLPAFGGLELESITPEQIDAWCRGASKRLGACVRRSRRCLTRTTGRATDRWRIEASSGARPSSDGHASIRSMLHDSAR